MSIDRTLMSTDRTLKILDWIIVSCCFVACACLVLTENFEGAFWAGVSGFFKLYTIYLSRHLLG